MVGQFHAPGVGEGGEIGNTADNVSRFIGNQQAFSRGVVPGPARIEMFGYDQFGEERHGEGFVHIGILAGQVEEGIDIVFFYVP